MIAWIISTISSMVSTEENEEEVSVPEPVEIPDPFLPNQFAQIYQLLDWATMIVREGASEEERRLFLERANFELNESPERFETEFGRLHTWAGEGIYPEKGTRSIEN